jgi:hypothetical protein
MGRAEVNNHRLTHRREQELREPLARLKKALKGSR